MVRYREQHHHYVTVHENKRHSEGRAILRKIARRAMIDRGLLPDFSPEELSELDRIHTASPEAEDSSSRPKTPPLVCYRQ